MSVDYFIYCMYYIHLIEREMCEDDEYEDDEKENE